MKYYLLLIRPINLIFIVVFYALIRYGFLGQQGLEFALTNFNYWLLILSMVCIAAAGYVINDIMDYDADVINKPKKVIIKNHISEKSAYNFYVALNLIGVGIGFYLSNVINKSNVFILFILLASLLYFYSSQLKKIVFLNNIVISIVMFISVMMVSVMDLYPKIEVYGMNTLKVFFDILLDYAWFAFFITLIREIIKDLEDEKGDREANYASLPIVIGLKKTHIILYILIGGVIIFLLNYINTFLMANDLYWSSAYLLLTVCGSLIWCFIRIMQVKKKSNYSQLSLVLKLILFFGMFSIVVTHYNIIYK
jgi:4-hydroxybenzoate polyprenyltransferase